MQPTPAPTSGPASPAPAPMEDASQQPFPEQPYNADTLPFHVLTAFFEKLQSERKQEKRRRLLNHWFNKWREDNGPDLFPVLRLLLPHRDRERSVYGLKEKALAKLYIKVIPLNKNDQDAQRLLFWKKPTEKNAASGDFPTVLYEVVRKRSSVTSSSLTIDEINDMLDQLADTSNKSEKQARVIQRLYNEATAEEQLWFARIILKDMNISVKETTVFAVFHPDAQALYNTCSDLKKVAWQLADPTIRLGEKDKNVKIFQSFLPMLCKRPTRRIEDTVKEMGGSEFIIEEKLDGERMQLHKNGNQFYYCSRKGKDYTYLYGAHVGIGSLTPHIAKQFHKQADNLILDGEMLVWDPVSGRNLPFGTLKTAALDQSKKQGAPRPCLKVFDLLYLNGQSLLNKSTAFRKKNMKLCVNMVPGRIEFADEFRGRTAQDIRDRMDEVMANRGEGLVIKHPKSQYVLNGRNNDWIKVKPEYMDNMGETVDVLVIAGNYGTGKRSGGVSTLICAVYDDRRAEQGEDDVKYSTFVRVGSGLTFADYIWIRSKNWKTWDPKNPPKHIQTAKRSHEDKGDVYLDVEDAFILKVKAAEITASDQYHMRYTMRFPRALSIRDEMLPSDCMTASAVLAQLKSEKQRKMETNAISLRKKRKVTTKKKVEMLNQFEMPDLKDVKAESDLFKGMKFVVISDPKARNGEEDKKGLIKLIRSHGGQCPQFAKDPAAIVVYGGMSTPYDLQLIIRKDTNDVMRPQWVIDCIAQGELVPMEKKYFFFATSERKTSDEFGGEEGAGSEGSVTEESSDEEVQAPSEGTRKRKRTPKSADSEPEPAAKTGDEEASGPPPKPKVELDPELAAWLGYDGEDEETTHEPNRKGDATEADSDNDSDNADVQNEEDAKEDDDMDFWLNDDRDDTEATRSALQDTQIRNDAPAHVDDIKMGDDNAMHYDEDLIFKHLCFYLDSPSNARANGMSVKSTKHEVDINKSFAELQDKIESNGGQVVDLSEPKLTHVVLDKRDLSRRIDLMKRTSKPKRRHLVLPAYIDACLEENTLLDEDDFAP